MLVVVVERLQHQNAWDYEEDIGVAALQQLPELLVFFGCAFYDSAEVD